MFKSEPLLKLLIKSNKVTNNFYKRAFVRGKPIDFRNLPDHQSLVLKEFSEPSENLILESKKIDQVLPKELGPKQILVEHLAAPVNPADINVIQGVYGIRPQLPAIIGGEGITRVKIVGEDVTHLKQGDLALAPNLIGYWQNYSIQDSDKFFKVDEKLKITDAAQLKVNPCSAYRMIKDFVKLKPGDTIIQNGANSAVGIFVIQLARIWGYKTVNIIRDRPNKNDLVNELRNFGADYVLTESEISTIEVTKPLFKEIPRPRLFLNCVGGKNAMSCQRNLDHGGYSVTYGAMSKQPFSLAAGPLIFKDHKYVGFWVTRWFENRVKSRREEVSAMLNEISDMFSNGTLRSKATTLIEFKDRHLAFSNSSNTKYLFSINDR